MSAAAAASKPARTPASPPAGQALDALFGALADPTRRALLQQLVVHGPASATRLVASSALTRQGIVKHLQALETAGLVAPERVGREVQYRATPEPLAAAVGWLLDTGAHWDRRIDRLRRAAARPSVAAEASAISSRSGAAADQ